MKNMTLAKNIFLALARENLQEVVVCAGARNAPLVQVLSGADGVKVYSFFEERSAAFFALGRILATGRPVAVVTTSGTAAAELLPAAIEADYQALPLVLVTADRPASYRGSGSPQTIVQPGLFSNYVEKFWDLEGEWSGEFLWSRSRPIHVNVCFDEPLLDGELAPLRMIPPHEQARMQSGAVDASVPQISAKKPLMIAGGLSFQRAQQVLPLLKQWGRPIWAEAPSRLRRHPELRDLEILGSETALKTMDFDGVIRLGGVPTFRFWRDLETSRLPVWNFSDIPFSGLARDRQVFSLDSVEPLKNSFEEWSGEERLKDRVVAGRLEQILNEFPLSEPAWMRRLSRNIPSQARIFLGNSLPIREWDLASDGQHSDIFANRGVNGIDGLISTFYGLADEQKPNWAVLGDLSTLYDLTGPWALGQRPPLDTTIAIINNGGGKIFERVFKNPLFENRHSLNFEHWAKMWNLSYSRLEGSENFVGASVVEIVPSNEHTAAFWRSWERV